MQGLLKVESQAAESQGGYEEALSKRAVKKVLRNKGRDVTAAWISMRATDAERGAIGVAVDDSPPKSTRLDDHVHHLVHWVPDKDHS